MRSRSAASSLLLLAFSAQAADLTGRFVSEENPGTHLYLEQRADGSVTGYVAFPSGPVALSARPSGRELRGTMRGEGESFEVRLRPEGERVLATFMNEPSAKPHPFRRAAPPKDEGVAIISSPSGGTWVVSRDSSEPPAPSPSTAPGAAVAGQTDRVVIVNGKRLSADELAKIERTYQVNILPADYWYDRKTGAWGIQGGPTKGFVLPDLELGGGRLAADASGGGTQVFINGRELHPNDVAFIQRCLVAPVQPGRYWVVADGTGGYEGGPPLFNLVALCNQRRSGGGSGGWGCSDGSCGTANTSVGATGITNTGDGDFGLHVDGKLLMRP